MRQSVEAHAPISVEDDVKIAADAVVVTPVGESLRIGRAARIGAGAVVTEDVAAFVVGRQQTL